MMQTQDYLSDVAYDHGCSARPDRSSHTQASYDLEDILICKMDQEKELQGLMDRVELGKLDASELYEVAEKHEAFAKRIRENAVRFLPV